MKEDNRGRLVLSVEQARKLLGLSRGLMYEAVRTGQLPNIRIGRRILIPRAALERFLEQGGTPDPRSARVATNSAVPAKPPERTLDGQKTP